MGVIGRIHGRLLTKADGLNGVAEVALCWVYQILNAAGKDSRKLRSRMRFRLLLVEDLRIDRTRHGIPARPCGAPPIR